MIKVLYIKATPKKAADSWTLKMSDFFLSEYLKHNPSHTVTELDLYQDNIAFLSERDLRDMMQVDKGDFAKYVDQFLDHDKYVIAAPLWNHSVPAVLKAYLDRIITVGKTFDVTEEGIRPINSGKKALFFMARGGIYSHGPLQELEFGSRYWQAVATTFLGLETVYHFLEGTGQFSIDVLKQALEKKQQQLKAEALIF